MSDRGAAVDWRLVGLFLLGLLISLLMLARSQVGGDQFNLLARGWLLADQGVWIQYGNPTSAGGKEPGGLTSVLVGLPLLVWRDYRAPVVLILLFHVAAYALLDRVVREVGGPRLRLIFCALYWLSPWRLYFSGFLLNPNYLPLFGAVHLWTAFRLRHQSSFWLSCLHSSAIGFACQLHPSAILLVFASALLLWRHRIAANWPGLFCGAGLVAVSLIPYAMSAWRDPALLPGQHGFPGRGLLLVYPLLRGLGMWFRFASLALNQKITNFDFAPALGAGVAWLVELALILARWVAAPLTLVAAALANRWVAIRVRRRRGRAWLTPTAWLQGYATYMFGAAVITYSLSPTTVMPWQCLPVLHAAVLPLALWAAALSRTRLAPQVRRAGVWWTALGLVFAIASAFGSPVYRSTGRRPETIPLAEHPILHDLGLAAQSATALGVPNGWRSDVLPEPDADGERRPP
jgi:hypothetical protein